MVRSVDRAVRSLLVLAAVSTLTTAFGQDPGEPQGTPEPVQAHVTALWGHVGATNRACPDLDDSLALTLPPGAVTLCAFVPILDFATFREAWDGFAEPGRETPTATPYDDWTPTDDGLFRRAYLAEGSDGSDWAYVVYVGFDIFPDRGSMYLVVFPL